MHPTYQNQRHEEEQVDIFLGPKLNTPIQAMPSENGPVHVEFRITRNVIESDTGAELGEFFETFQKVKSTRTAIEKMSHQQPPNIDGNGKYSSKKNRYWNGKIKRPRAIDMKFYWVRDKIQQNNSHIFWGYGNKNLADYVTKHYPIWHHITMRPRYLKATKKHIKLKIPENWDRKNVHWNYQYQGNPETG